MNSTRRNRRHFVVDAQSSNVVVVANANFTHSQNNTRSMSRRALRPVTAKTGDGKGDKACISASREKADAIWLSCVAGRYWLSMLYTRAACDAANGHRRRDTFAETRETRMGRKMIRHAVSLMFYHGLHGAMNFLRVCISRQKSSSFLDLNSGPPSATHSPTVLFSMKLP